MTARRDIAISVVIPCHNSGGSLREAIHSALMQSHPALEVLVIDDGSTDDSAAVAVSFGPPVRVIGQEHRGGSAARNRGLDEARGDWVAFLDAADVWHPEKLRRQVEAIGDATGDVVCSYTDYFLFTDDGDRREVRARQPGGRDDRVAIILDRCGHASSSLVLGSAARAVRFPEDIRHGGERAFFLKLQEQGSFLHVPHFLTGYRSPGGRKADRVDELLDSSRSYLAILERFGLTAEERDEIREKILSDLALGHRRAYYARDTRATRAYREMYDEVAGEVGARPAEMAKPIYPRIVFRIKDKIDALTRHVSPTNGHYDREFYRNVEDRTVSSAARCVPAFLDVLAPRSVVDIGCGRGHWLNAFRELGVADVVGIEGPHLDFEEAVIPRHRLCHKDLARPFRLDRAFDVALCLEVAEHLPPASAEGFVESLTRLAPRIVFSAALPGQGGVDHVNERWPWYWKQLFARHNFVRFDPFRRRFWGDPRVADYYQQNLFLYVRSDVAQAVMPRLGELDGQGLTLVSERVLRGLTERSPG